MEKSSRTLSVPHRVLFKNCICKLDGLECVWRAQPLVFQNLRWECAGEALFPSCGERWGAEVLPACSARCSATLAGAGRRAEALCGAGILEASAALSKCGPIGYRRVGGEGDREIVGGDAGVWSEPCKCLTYAARTARGPLSVCCSVARRRGLGWVYQGSFCNRDIKGSAVLLHYL